MKYLIFSFLGIFALAYYILHTTYYIPDAYAQTSGTSGTCSPIASATPIVEDGLVSTPDLGPNGIVTDSNGVCVIDPRAAFAPYKIPTYDDLKSLYYTQAKVTIRKETIAAAPSQGAFTSAFTQNDIVLVNGDLPNVNYTGTTKPSIIFVEGSLSISSNITYGDANSGIVFVVKGDVIIDPTVTSIDAVIISGGTIYTAGAGCSQSLVLADQLIINGSLISLGTNSIKFCRTLDPTNPTVNNSNSPAEKVKHQIKYLVILRNLLSDTYQKWSEIQ